MKGLALFGVAVIAWLAGGSLPLVAITAGAAMVAVAQRDPAYAINRVEWSLLLFFGSLFVVMRGFERAVAGPWIHAHGLGVAWGSDWSLATTLSAVMVVLANLVSNVPAVMLWRSVIPNLPRADLVWRLLAMSSTFAGNLLPAGPLPTCAPNTSAAQVPSSAIAANRVQFMLTPHGSPWRSSVTPVLDVSRPRSIVIQDRGEELLSQQARSWTQIL